MTSDRKSTPRADVAHYADPFHPTGLWLSALTHAYYGNIARSDEIEGSHQCPLGDWAEPRIGEVDCEANG